MTEHDLQVAVVQWAAYVAKDRFPSLALLHAIPNGGARSATEGARLKREGVKRGVPDLCLPVPRGVAHGLYIELKTPTGRIQPEQHRWLADLAEQGYRTAVCRTLDEARATITEYLTQ